MASSSASNPSKSRDEEFMRLDELISELYALKSLYGLLHNNTAGSSQPSTCALDEKSWHLLKKLLDGAAQEALQPIAKTVACSSEPGQMLAKLNSATSPHSDFPKEAQEIEKYRECHSALLETAVAVCTPTAQPKIIQTTCPSVDQPVRPRRPSKDYLICPGLIDSSDNPDHCIMSRMSESNNMKKSIHQSNKTLISHRISDADRPAPNPDNGGELLTPVHALKRARVEQVDLPTRTSNRAPKNDLIDRELTHQKRTGKKETTEPNNKIVLTQTRRKEPGTEQVDLPTRTSNRAPKNDLIDRELTHQKRTGKKETTEPNNKIVLTQTRRKEPGTEQVDLPTRTSNLAPKNDLIDRELTHQKRTGKKETTEPNNKIVLTQTRRKEPGTELNRDRSTRRAPSSKHQDSIVLAGDRAAQIVCKNYLKAESKAPGTTKKHIGSNRKGSKAKGRFLSPASSKSALCSSNSFSRSAGSAYSTHPRHEKRVVTKNNKMKRAPKAKTRANKPIVPVRFTNQEAGTYSSLSSYSSRTARSSMLTRRRQKQEKKTRNRGRKRLSPSPPKPLSTHLSLIPRRKLPHRQPPPNCKPAKVHVEGGVEEEGKLKKLKNKLAIIFHHHHHLHKSEEDEKGAGFGRKEQERSLWKYLKGVLHVNRGTAEEHGHILHLMMEWFFHNLWGMRRRHKKKKKKQMKKPRAGKKLKWWEWFKSRRGVVVGGGCRRRNRLLSLRFNGSHLPTANREGVATSKR